MKISHNKAIVMIIAASVLWSFAGVCIKVMTWNGYAIVGIRGLIAAAVLLPFIGKPRLPRGRYQILAMLCYFGMIFFTSIATKMTSAGNAILLQYTSPVYSAFLGYWILKEPVTKRDILSILIVFAGLVVFFYDGIAGGRLAGNLIALLSGICSGGMNVFMKADPEADPAQNVFWGNLLAFAVTLPFFGKIEWTRMNLMIILFMGIFQLGLSFVLYSRAIRYVGALEAILVGVLEPVLSPTWAMLAGKESFSVLSLIGGAMVIFAIFFRNIRIPRPAQAEA